MGQKVLHFKDPVSKLELIDDSRYKPDSLTKLFDTMGFSFAKLKDELENRTDLTISKCGLIC